MGCGRCGWAEDPVYKNHKSLKDVNKYMPIKRSYKFKMPRKPVINEHGQTPGYEFEGVVGIAINGVSIVGHHVEKSGQLGDMTMMFDNCGGHGDIDHRYHYHIPPMCLIKSLGGTVPARSDWWLSAHPESQWPPIATASVDGELSPLLGWALDGSPIFAPYDPETGKLQVSKEAGCVGDDMSELDDCNGKTLSNGLYAYFITPTYPYVPKCLKGDISGISKMDDLESMLASNSNAPVEVCNIKGYAPMKVERLQDCVTAPQDLFLEIEESPKWVASTAVIGSLFLVTGSVLALIAQPATLSSFAKAREQALQQTGGRLASVVLGLYFSIFAVVFLRAMFLLIDPYRMRKLFPRVLQSLMYGLVFPLVNLQAVYLLYMLDVLRGKKYNIALGVVGCQFLVQAIMDILRAIGEQPEWHFICQAFYAAWGGVVLGAAMYYCCMTKRPAAFVASFLSFVEIMMSIVLLSVSLGSAESSKYFAVMTFLRLLEALVAMAYTGVIWEWMQLMQQHIKGVHSKMEDVESPSPSGMDPNGFEAKVVPTAEPMAVSND